MLSSLSSIVNQLKMVVFNENESYFHFSESNFSLKKCLVSATRILNCINYFVICFPLAYIIISVLFLQRLFDKVLVILNQFFALRVAKSLKLRQACLSGDTCPHAIN